MNRIYVVFSAIAFAFAMTVSQVAHAHKVNLFAYAEEGEVSVEGYFVDGKKALNSTVQVFNSAGDMLVEGETDGEGVFRFPIPEKSDLKITLNAGMGHKGVFSLAADELGSEALVVEGAHSHDHSDNQGHHHAGDAHHHSDDKGHHGESQHHHASADSDTGSVESADSYRSADADIEKIVRKAVNEAIKPLVRELEESQQKASLSGIVGGVGYIIGFLGLFAFIKARQQVAKSSE